MTDFSLARGSDGTVYLVGGQTASGESVSLSTIGKWTSADGWTSQETKGNAPAGRVGASLVAHPTLDLLVLHGGEVSSASTSTLALLNTTSWSWSVPTDLQSSSAVAYHSSVITDEGVMISSFGLDSSNQPSSTVNYLDMRSSSTSDWAWKSEWSSDMLRAYSSSSSSSTSASSSSAVTGSSASASSSGAATGNSVAAADSKSSSSSSSNSVKIAVPIVVVFAVCLPILFFCVRRRIRTNKKRREASQFSFETQEDSGEFQGAIGNIGAPSRRTRTQYGFGHDANEKEGNIFSDAVAGIRRFTTRGRRLSGSSNTTAEDRAMAEEQNATIKRFDEKNMRWEEIDFGLGELDKRASQGSHSSATRGGVDPFADPVEGQLIDISEPAAPAAMTEMSEHVPTIRAVPPSAPRSGVNGQLVDAAPGFNPSSTDGLDWQLLAADMQTKPAFRSIAPAAAIRSHAHQPLPKAKSKPQAAPIRPALPFAPVNTAAAAAPSPSSAYSAYSSVPPTASAPGPAPVVTADPAQASRSSCPPPRLPELDFEHKYPSKPSTAPTSAAGSRSVSQPVGPRQLTRVIPRVQPPSLDLVHADAETKQSTPVSAPAAITTFPAAAASAPVALSRRVSQPSSSPSSGLGSPVSLSKRDSSQLRVTNRTDMDDDDITTEESFGQAI